MYFVVPSFNSACCALLRPMAVSPLDATQWRSMHRNQANRSPYYPSFGLLHVSEEARVSLAGLLKSTSRDSVIARYCYSQIRIYTSVIVCLESEFYVV